MCGVWDTRIVLRTNRVGAPVGVVSSIFRVLNPYTITVVLDMHKQSNSMLILLLELIGQDLYQPDITSVSIFNSIVN